MDSEEKIELETKILLKTKSLIHIQWEDHTGFGVLMICVAEDGTFKIDSEMISLDRFLKIIQSLNTDYISKEEIYKACDLLIDRAKETDQNYQHIRKFKEILEGCIHCCTLKLITTQRLNATLVAEACLIH